MLDFLVERAFLYIQQGSVFAGTEFDKPLVQQKFMGRIPTQPPTNTPPVIYIPTMYSYGALEEARPDVFKFLIFLAGPSVVRQLKEYLFNTGGTRGQTNINRLENLVCLGGGYHGWFGPGEFVLEPVGDPLAGLGNHGLLWSYEVKFSWVTQNQSRQGTNTGPPKEIGTRQSMILTVWIQ